MKLTARTILSLLFIVICTVSLVYISYSGINYGNYYWEARAAMLDSDTNNTMVNKVLITRDSSTGTSTVHVNSQATNPTRYQGLTLRSFQVSLYFVHAGNLSESIFSKPIEYLLGGIYPGEPLGPMATVRGSILIHLSQQVSDNFQAFNQTYQGQDITAHVVLTTSLDSFLDPVYGNMVTVKTIEVPMS